MWIRKYTRRKNSICFILVVILLFTLGSITSYGPRTIHNRNDRFVKIAEISEPVKKLVEVLPALKNTQTPFKHKNSTIYHPDTPNILTYMKHKPHMNIFQPIKMVSRKRDNVTLVIGIPHVNREVAFYMKDTLTSLISNLEPYELNSCLIVVLLCDKDEQYNEKMILQLQESFPVAIKSGLLELIIPSSSFYPNFHNLAKVVNRGGDSVARWIWRSKENLDAAYLINYAHHKGTFYLMLEDDVLVEPGYFNQIVKFASNPPRQDWYFIEFSDFGSIGLLFQSKDCPVLINYLLMFYTAWPIDWLLSKFLNIWACRQDESAAMCTSKATHLKLVYSKSLFHHIGLKSSLKGKIVQSSLMH